MYLKKTLANAAFIFSACAAQAQDSAIAIGKSTFVARCAVCHGDDGQGGGEIGELLRVPPPDLAKISERAGGEFPIIEVYSTIVGGMERPGHGGAAMPVWGRYFMADALEDRGVSKVEAMEIAAGRVLAVVYYLESIQE